VYFATDAVSQPHLSEHSYPPPSLDFNDFPQHNLLSCSTETAAPERAGRKHTLKKNKKLA
jgi:hypothetical protein